MIYRYTMPTDDGEHIFLFYPAGDEFVGEQEIEELPPDSVDIKKFSHKWAKDRRIGLPEVPTLEFDVDKNRLPDSTSKLMFLNPFKERINTIPNIPAVIKAGTVVEWYHPQQSDPYFIGVLRHKTKGESDRDSFVISCTAEDVNRAVVDSINFDWLTIVEETPDAFTYTGIVEARSGSTVYYSTLPPDGISYVFDKFDVIRLYLSAAGSQVFTNITRGRFASNYWSCDLALQKYYRQNYDTPSAAGTALIQSELYVLAYIKNASNERIGGLFIEQQGIRQFSSAWDFLSVVSEQGFFSVALSPKGIKFYGLHGSIGELQIANGTIDEEMIESISYEEADPLFTATASAHEKAGSDIGSKEYLKTASRNQTELTIPVLFTNYVPASNWKQRRGTWYKGDVPHIFGLYYNDNGVPYKVSTEITYYAKTGIEVGSSSIVSPFVYGDSQPLANAIATQTNGSIMEKAVNVAMSFFSDPLSRPIEIEIDSYHTDALLKIAKPAEYTLTASVIDPDFNMTDKYSVRELELDFSNMQLTLTMEGRFNNVV